MKPILFIISTLFLITLTYGCKTKQKILKIYTSENFGQELHLYDIRGSMEATVYMYEIFGMWGSLEKEQNSVYKRLYTWNDVDLMNKGTLYTVSSRV